jgi:hypothetical protein
MEKVKVEKGRVTVFQNGSKIIDKFKFTSVDENGDIDTGYTFHNNDNNSFVFVPPGMVLLIEQVNRIN